MLGEHFDRTSGTREVKLLRQAWSPLAKKAQRTDLRGRHRAAFGGWELLQGPTIFRQITGDRYKRVAIEPSLDPVVKGLEDENILPEELSQGARDQLYFAMRVAMGEHLSHQIRLPLLLDDPFVNFDAGRRDEARRVLDTLDDHQVIMMSCHPDYREWTDHVIDLDAMRANPN